MFLPAMATPAHDFTCHESSPNFIALRRSAAAESVSQSWHLVKMELEKKQCLACEGGVSALPQDEVERLLSQLSGWSVEPSRSELRKRFRFAGFVETIAFVNRMADLAESEGHHPDFCVRFANLDVTLTTHAVGGLTENDFILAAKIDVLAV